MQDNLLLPVPKGLYILINSFIVLHYKILTRLTVGTGEHINVEDEDDGKNKSNFHQNLQPIFPELSHSIQDDTRSVRSTKSFLEDDSKKRFDLKTSLSQDSIKCEYVY